MMRLAFVVVAWAVGVVGAVDKFAGQSLQSVLAEAQTLQEQIIARSWTSNEHRKELVEGCVERLEVLVKSGLDDDQASSARHTIGVMLSNYLDPPDFARAKTEFRSSVASLPDVPKNAERRATEYNELVVTEAVELAHELKNGKKQRTKTDDELKSMRNSLATTLNTFEEWAFGMTEAVDPGLGALYCKAAVAALPVLVHYSQSDGSLVEEMIRHVSEQCDAAHALLRKPQTVDESMRVLGSPAATKVAKMVAHSRALSSVYKLEHDIEQLDLLSPLFDDHATDLRAAMARVASPNGLMQQGSETELAAKLFRTVDAFPSVEQGAGKFNSHLYRHEPEDEEDYLRTTLMNSSADGEELWKRSGVFNPLLDTDGLQDAFFEESESHILVVDDLLSPDALYAAQQDILRSTYFHNLKLGYLGAYHYDGLNSEIFLRVGAMLPRLLPRIFDAHEVIVNMWAYKYIGDDTGIAIHADSAAVNVNIWLTPDEFNLGSLEEGTGGGLVVYKRRPPPNWSFGEYNSDSPKTRAFLAEDDFANITVPFKSNRAVIFDSMLFHKTDHFDFIKSHKGRRVNLTFLYGRLHAIHHDDDPPAKKKQAEKAAKKTPKKTRKSAGLREL